MVLIVVLIYDAENNAVFVFEGNCWSASMKHVKWVPVIHNLIKFCYIILNLVCTLYFGFSSLIVTVWHCWKYVKLRSHLRLCLPCIIVHHEDCIVFWFMQFRDLISVVTLQNKRWVLACSYHHLWYLLNKCECNITIRKRHHHVVVQLRSETKQCWILLMYGSNLPFCLFIHTDLKTFCSCPYMFT